jgi:hypothetical protein
MSDILTKWRVGDCVSRLTLLRVEPGREIEVGRLIEKRCASVFPAANSFRVFRLFGSYDLLIIQDDADLAHSGFVNIGSIPYVTGSTEYICNKWIPRSARSKAPTFSLNALSDPLLAMCFLKINPEITQEFGLVPELSLAHYTRQKLPSVQMLSTFGWAEVVLLISAKSLGEILEAIGNHLPGLLFYRGKLSPFSKSFVEKTLTIIGHNLDISDPRTRATQVRVPIATGLTDLDITFSVACKPRSGGILSRSAARFFGKDSIRSRLGARDLEFNVSLREIETLNDLLKKLDGFRAENKGSLIHTHTVFKYRKVVSRSRARGELVHRKPFYVPVSPKEARILTNAGPQGAAVATAIYQFNNLIQNDISSDVYLDLLRFVIALKKEMLSAPTRRGQKLSLTFLRIIAQKLSHLDIALVQRSQSVYVGLEENPFGSYPAGVGLQRVLKALDAYAITILSRLGGKWNGFVRFGHRSSRMEHFADVFIVPMDVSVSATRHWTFTHETMHVLQDIKPDVLSLKKILRSNRFGEEITGAELVPGTNPWLVVLESMADVLDFALCCPLPLDQYLSTIWKYLDAEIFSQQVDSQLSMYLWRSFSVIAYDHYRKSKKNVAVLFNRELMSSLLKNYVRRLSKWTDLTALTRKDERGQERLMLIFERFLNEFIFYLPSAFRTVDSLAATAVQPKKRADVRSITRLEKGFILTPAEIRYANQIAWKMSERASIDGTRLNVAWLLSLWHYYQTARLGPDLKSLTKEPTPRNRRRSASRSG